MKTQIASLALAAATLLNVSSASALSISQNPYYYDIPLTAEYVDASCDLWGQVSSRRSHDQITFNFTNHTNTWRIVSWLDFNGHVKEYAELAPGRSIEISTYEGHPWMIQDGRGDCKEILQNGGYVAELKPVFYPKDDPHVKVVKVHSTNGYGGYLNLRTGPSVKHGKIGKLPEGYQIEVLKRAKNGWAKIELPTGHVGWVNAKYLKTI